MSQFTDISAIYTDRVSFSSFELFTSLCIISYTLYIKRGQQSFTAL